MRTPKRKFSGILFLNCFKKIFNREKKEDRGERTIRRSGFEEMEPLEQFLSYRQSEFDRYQMSFDQEQLRYDERDKLGTRNVPITEYVYSDLHLRAEIPVVAVNLSKKLCRCEIWNGVRSLVGGLE
jgi:hypothetical protein